MKSVMIMKKLIKEEKELSNKLYKLKDFIRENKYKEGVIGPYHLKLLEEQVHHMQQYANVLKHRINDLKGSE